MTTMQKTASMNSGAVGAKLSGGLLSTPTSLLRLENLAILIALLFVYGSNDYAWWLIPALVLAPDLSMLGYLAGTRIGSKVYNAAHIYASPVLLGLIAWSIGWPLGMPLALIWAMHIALDRTIGYGLKYTDSFKHTHLSPTDSSQTTPTIQSET